MKKIILLTLLTSTAYADEISYTYQLKDKCKKTKNRKICHRAIKAVIALAPKYHKKQTSYQQITWMLEVPCLEGSTWQDEACKLRTYYTEKGYFEVMGDYPPSYYRRKRRGR